MTKSRLVNQINDFYADLATEEPVYHNCYITKDDLNYPCRISEILYDLKENYFVHEASLPLYRKVKKFTQKKKPNIVHIIDTILVIIAICLLLWAGASYIEILCKNLTPNPVYSPINFFSLITNL